MKKFLLLTTAVALALPAASHAQGTLKVGTVDMNRASKEYKKALDEINKLNQQLDSPALSADKKTSMAKERDDKIANIKNMEREINDFRQTRERQLQEQAMRMRETLVKEITDVIMDRVKSSGYDMVFDKSGQSTNFIAVVMYAKDSM